MDLRTAIDQTFQGKAFARPLFYSYPGGLRFELSESGSPLDMVWQALAKAQPICNDLFGTTDSLVVCLRQKTKSNPFAHRKTIRELRHAGIALPPGCTVWLDAVEEDDRFDEDVEEWWLTVAFAAPVSLLRNVLWCAFASDFGCIGPHPGCAVYLFDLSRGVMAFPYDDRGMDVVGPNHEALKTLFIKHRCTLLEHDMAEMLQTFESASLGTSR